MAINLLYTFPDLATSEADFDFTGASGALLQAAGTAAYWCWNDTTTASTGTGPSGGVAAVGGEAAGTTLSSTATNGYVYTETSSPGVGADVFIMDLTTPINCDINTNVKVGFWTNISSANGDNQPLIELQVNEGGGGWVTKYTADGTVLTAMLDATASGTSDFWYKHLVDLTAAGVTNASTLLRWQLTTNNAVTTYQCDIGVDYIEITGDTTTINVQGPISGSFAAITGDATVKVINRIYMVDANFAYVDGTPMKRGITVNANKVSDGTFVGSGKTDGTGNAQIAVVVLSTNELVYLTIANDNPELQSETVCTHALRPYEVI